MGDITCMTVDRQGKFQQFSRAEHLVLIGDGSIIHREPNPVLKSSNKRPTLTKRCVELGAQVVLAPHGSLCFPSYSILRRANVVMYMVNPGDAVNDGYVPKPMGLDEVAYSSLLTVVERVREVLSHE